MTKYKKLIVVEIEANSDREAQELINAWVAIENLGSSINGHEMEFSVE